MSEPFPVSRSLKIVRFRGKVKGMYPYSSNPWISSDLAMSTGPDCGDKETISSVSVMTAGLHERQDSFGGIDIGFGVGVSECANVASSVREYKVLAMNFSADAATAPILKTSIILHVC